MPIDGDGYSILVLPNKYSRGLERIPVPTWEIHKQEGRFTTEDVKALEQSLRGKARPRRERRLLSKVEFDFNENTGTVDLFGVDRVPQALLISVLDEIFSESAGNSSIGVPNKVATEMYAEAALHGITVEEVARQAWDNFTKENRWEVRRRTLLRPWLFFNPDVRRLFARTF